MSLDKFLHCKYDPDHYNCGHFVCDLWEHLTSTRIHGAVKTLLLPEKIRYADMTLRSSVQQLKQCVNPCIVIMSKINSTTHAGVYTRDRVFHLSRSGAKLEPLATASFGYTKVRFYTC